MLAGIIVDTSYQASATESVTTSRLYAEARSMPDNDNDSAMRGTLPASLMDPHGHAALLLTESLIHGLCEKNLLTTMEAMEITERAVSVQADRAEAADGAGQPLWHAHALLTAIATSLSIDVEPPAPPHLVR